MRGYNIGSRAYHEGMNYLRKKNYSMAKQWFYVSLREVRYQNDSLSKLIVIDLKEGNLKHARELMEQYYYFDTNYAFGLLEETEYNFNASKKYFMNCTGKNDKLKARIAIPQVEMQLGNYDTATLQLQDALEVEKEEKIRFEILYQLILINIYKKQYDEASKLLNKVNKIYQNIGIKDQHNLRFLLDYLQGRKSKIPDSYKNIYIINRMFDKSGELLLNHVKEHLNPLEKNLALAYFFQDTNIEDLIEEVEKKLEDKNPNHFDISDIYRLRLDQPIGYANNELTRDIYIATYIGTKDIITMYPIQLSSGYDRENFFTSEELRLKRSHNQMN